MAAGFWLAALLRQSNTTWIEEECVEVDNNQVQIQKVHQPGQG